jgi:dethiobiotin synthetase
MIKNCFLVVAVGTDIGKTYLVEKLCQKRNSIKAIKPIASGFDDQDLNSDSARILTSMSQEINIKNINQISPWRFKEAASPHFAAENIGKEIDYLEVLKFCSQSISQAISQTNSNQTLLIETAGGIMTPINYKKTFLDLAADLKIKVLLITANYLGSISHTLSVVECLKNKKIFIEKIIVNQNLPLILAEKKCQKINQTIEKMSGIPTTDLSDFISQF